MKTLPAAMACGLVLGFAAAAQAGEVTVKSMHLCCGQCDKLAAEALKDVDGVSGAKVDRPGKTVTFTATDDKAAEAGIKALAEEGFYGKATHGGKEVKFPESGAKEGDTSDSLTLSQVHLCCGMCVTAVKKALDDLDGVEKVEADRDERTVTVSGKGIKTSAAVKALNDAGFYAKVKS
ncbi:MAG TPA: cation transporter [Planctomycetaceae bacterium]|nr:cation transporter [Planctomycetaceae bacterium]